MLAREVGVAQCGLFATGVGCLVSRGSVQCVFGVNECKGDEDAPTSLSESESESESEPASASESLSPCVECTARARGYLNKCARKFGACPRRARKNRKRLLM